MDNVVFRTALLAISLTLPGIASASEIEHQMIGDDVAGIAITGQITSADVERFRAVSIRYKKAVVLLESPGGSLLPALEIGKMIRLRGYTTFVPPEAVCTSSCALIWLAGAPRQLARQGKIGFHASYRDNAGKLEESGVANALVGNYLTLLNMPERAVVFATLASPKEISWLTPANKNSAGIDFEEFDFEDKSQPTKRAAASTLPSPITSAPLPPPKLVTVQPRPGVSYWFHYGTDTNGSQYFYDVNSITKSGDYVSFWEDVNHSEDVTVKHRRSMSHARLDCKIQSMIFLDILLYDKNGKNISRSGGGVVQIVPGSMGMSLWRSLCGGGYSPWTVDNGDRDRMFRIDLATGETEEVISEIALEGWRYSRF